MDYLLLQVRCLILVDPQTGFWHATYIIRRSKSNIIHLISNSYRKTMCQVGTLYFNITKQNQNSFHCSTKYGELGRYIYSRNVRVIRICIECQGFSRIRKMIPKGRYATFSIIETSNVRNINGKINFYAHFRTVHRFIFFLFYQDVCGFVNTVQCSLQT